MVAESIQSIYEARCSKLRRLELNITADNGGWVEQVHTTLSAFKDGNCAVTIDYCQPNARGTLKLGHQWKVQPRDELISRLRQQFGKTNVSMGYD